MRWLPALVALALLVPVAGCGQKKEPNAGAEEPEPTGAAATAAPDPAPAAAPTGETPRDLPSGLLVTYSQFPVVDGKATATPGAALLEMFVRRGGAWTATSVEDDGSNVFHKALVLGGDAGGVVTLGAEAAAVKRWRRGGDGWTPDTLWTEEFGGRFDRMRDAEIGDVDGDGVDEIVVGTHDQGVVAVLDTADGGRSWTATRLHEAKDTFIHEIELGDLDGDGTMEIYATPSEPNDLSGDTVQRGAVIRLDPAGGAPAKIVADLGDRHAKEILVADVDGDGRDELYVAVEGKTSGSGASVQVVESVEIRRYDGDTAPTEGAVIARIDGERFTRFLTAGDVDGDGKREMVAASFRKGLWLLRPGTDARGEWGIESIDRASSGFEHAALLADLDGDGTDELYVAADEQGELRRYAWVGGRPRREVIARRAVPAARMTWNITTVPATLVSP